MDEDSLSGTLHGVLKAKRDRLIACWGDRIKNAVSSAAVPRAALLDHIPLFVDDIIRALYPQAVPLPAVSMHAEEHGEQRLGLGFDVAEVVREYGVLHECILQMAAEADLVVSPRDQEIVVRWLNMGIADAVGEYVRQRDLELQRQTSEHLGFIAHELRSPLGVARMAFHRLRQTQLTEDRTVEMLDRGLRRTSEMIDSVLNHASLKMGVVPKVTPIALRMFLHEIESDAVIEAQAKAIDIVVSAPEDLTIEADTRLLRSAVANLLHNALKFSHDGSTVTLTAARAEGRVTIAVADGCGGLPPGRADELFAPLVQRGENRSGFGLGLAIAMQAAEAHNGTIKVKDLPPVGCMFIVDLPSTAI